MNKYSQRTKKLWATSTAPVFIFQSSKSNTSLLYTFLSVVSRALILFRLCFKFTLTLETLTECFIFKYCSMQFSVAVFIFCGNQIFIPLPFLLKDNASVPNYSKSFFKPKVEYWSLIIPTIQAKIRAILLKIIPLIKYLSSSDLL